MRIFIDESGTFIAQAHGLPLSCVGALIIPNIRWTALQEAYARIRPGLLQAGNTEVKGRLLDEDQISAVIRLLIEHDALFEVVAVDGRMFTPEDIATHRTEQGRRIVLNPLGNPHQPVLNWLSDLRTRLDGLSNPLYVQTVAMTTLVINVLRHASLYFVQRVPEELSNFDWVIDGKGATDLVPMETWWRECLSMFVHSTFIRERFGILVGADYSHFFRRFSAPVPPAMLRIMRPVVPGTPSVSAKKIVRDSFQFLSGPEPGLELVDIVTNATRRALTGNLGLHGWQDLPRLMVHRERQYIDFVSLGQPADVAFPYREPLSRFFAGGREMLV